MALSKILQPLIIEESAGHGAETLELIGFPRRPQAAVLVLAPVSNTRTSPARGQNLEPAAAFYVTYFLNASELHIVKAKKHLGGRTKRFSSRERT
jgi:hypothetical protein